MSRTTSGILSFGSPSGLVATLLVFIAVVTTLTPTSSWAANGQCSLAVNTTTANWHDSSTWTGCTGAGGLPGTNESVTLSGQGVVITIQANKAAVVVTYLYVGDYARLLNHGDLTATAQLTIQNGGEITSDGALAVVSSTSGSSVLSISFGHLAHTGDLVIGTTSTTSNETISAVFVASEAKVAIGGALSILGTETGTAVFSSSGTNIKTGSTFRMTGGTGGTQWSSSEVDINVVEGNLALGTWDAATYANLTGSISLSMSVGTVLLSRGNLLIETGAAKGDGYSGSISANLNAINVAVAGEVMIKSGDINAQDNSNTAGSVAFSMNTGSFVVTAVDGVDGSGSVIMQGGNGGAGISGNGGSGAYVQWEAELVHMSVAKDLILTGGNGGNSNSSTGGEGGSAYFGSNGNVFNAAIGRDLYVSSGDAGKSNYGQGGSTYGAFLEFNNGGSLTVGRDVVLYDGTAGSGVDGGYVYSGYFELEDSTKMTVGGNFKMGSATAGSSTGGGYGGSCESPDKKKKRDTTKSERGGASSNGPIYIYRSTLEVTGDMNVIVCNAGNGLGGNGGSAWSQTYFTVYTGCTVTIGGSLTFTGGSGGNAVNTTAFPTSSYLNAGNGASKYLVGQTDVVFSVSGDLIISGGSGGNVTGASGTSGSAGSLALEAYMATFNIDGNLQIMGSKAGSVSAASVTNSTGLPGASCGLIAYAIEEGVINVGGDVSLSGCDSGSVSTQIISSGAKRAVRSARSFRPSAQLADKRGFFGGNSAGEAAIVTYLSSKFVVAGSLTLVGGTGGDATANDATFGGLAVIAAEYASSVHVEGATTLTGGRGGDSSQSYGGAAGYAGVYGFSVSQLRTGDLTVKGGRAGQGFNSSFDGQFGPVLLELLDEGQLQQYGQVTITEGSYRNFTVSMPTSEVSFVGATQSSQWTIMPCATGGVSYTSSNSSTFAVTLASVFRDCRGSGATVQSRPTGDISSDVSCLGCTCTSDVLLFDECSGSMLHSAAFEMVVAVLEVLAGFW